MNIVIIEDENIAARRLERIIGELGFSVSKKLNSVKKSIEWFKENKDIDLIFLDIHLGDGLSFEIFEQVKIDAYIIFTTAYDKYAIKAFKLKAIDYLLKPIDKQELCKAIDKYKLFVHSNNNSTENIQIDQLRELLHTKKYKDRFLVKKGCHIQSIKTENIVCFYSEDKTTYLHTDEQKNYIIDSSLDSVEDKIDKTKFFRINRKFIININHISDIIIYSNSRLKIKIDNFQSQDMIVSREKVLEFKTLLD